MREQVVQREQGLEPRLELELGQGREQVWAVQLGQQQGRGLAEQELGLEQVQLQELGQGRGLVEQLEQGRAKDPWQGRAQGKCR